MFLPTLGLAHPPQEPGYLNSIPSGVPAVLETVVRSDRVVEDLKALPLAPCALGAVTGKTRLALSRSDSSWSGHSMHVRALLISVVVESEGDHVTEEA